MPVSYSLVAGTLNAEGISIHADFFTLRSSQVEILCVLAKLQGYKHPKNANGSKARYYFAALQRSYKKGN